MEQNVVIILSDDDEDCTVLSDLSVLIMEGDAEEEKTSEKTKSEIVLDEDLAITYTQRGEVMPHARFDCTVPFCPAESDLTAPLEKNDLFCEQCFCYICDKPASKCKFWSIPGICHCNAHKRSVYWKTLRDKSIMGYLYELSFTFDLLEIDADLRRAESLLQDFSCRLALEYAAYLNGTRLGKPPSCPCHSSGASGPGQRTGAGTTEPCAACQDRHHAVVLHDYTGVYEYVASFLDAAERENPKTCAVMLLGAAKLFITHSSPVGDSKSKTQVLESVRVLIWRVVSRVEVLMVSADFPASFTKQLQTFYWALPLPYGCRAFRNSLQVLSWDDPLLSAVRRGQNVSGERQVKGRKAEVLFESILVVQARVQKLLQQKKYQELARYLRVVKSDNNALLQAERDLVPLYLCRVGNFMGAISCLLSSTGASPCPATRLTPARLAAYMRIFTSGHAPSASCPPAAPHTDPTLSEALGHASTTGPDHIWSSQWTPIESCTPLKKLEVVKFTLNVMNCNSAAFADSQTWVGLLNVASCSSIGPEGSAVPVSYPEPSFDFQMRTHDAANSILADLSLTSRIQIPRNFQFGFPDQALLLLVTQALARRILQSPLSPVLCVIRAYMRNPWALHVLYYSLACRPEVLQVLLSSILEELKGEQHVPSPWREDVSANSFMANLISLFFMDSRLALHFNRHPTDDLLEVWNENDCLWQFHLRCLLDMNEANLTPAKLRILQIIRGRSGH